MTKKLLFYIVLLCAALICAAAAFALRTGGVNLSATSAPHVPAPQTEAEAPQAAPLSEPAAPRRIYETRVSKSTALAFLMEKGVSITSFKDSRLEKGPFGRCLVIGGVSLSEQEVISRFNLPGTRIERVYLSGQELVFESGGELAPTAALPACI